MDATSRVPHCCSPTSWPPASCGHSYGHLSTAETRWTQSGGAEPNTPEDNRSIRRKRERGSLAGSAFRVVRVFRGVLGFCSAEPCCQIAPAAAVASPRLTNVGCLVAASSRCVSASVGRQDKRGIVPEKAVERRRRKVTKLSERALRAKPPARRFHPQGESRFPSGPILLRAFAPSLFIPTAESRIIPARVRARQLAAGRARAG